MSNEDIPARLQWQGRWDDFLTNNQRPGLIQDAGYIMANPKKLAYLKLLNRYPMSETYFIPVSNT